MNERPILFSGAMARAILEGRKTQTRRVIKPQPIQGVYKYDGVTPTFQWKDQINTCRPIWPDVMNEYCPYGQPGDRLWVRETFSIVPATAYRASEGVHQTIDPNDPHDAAIYRAGWDRSDPGTRWRPSIFMPRWASRITLEIVSIDAERVQDISSENAMHEGITAPMLNDKYSTMRGGFSTLWDDINAKRGYGWDVNPWVWVVEFKRMI